MVDRSIFIQEWNKVARDVHMIAKDRGWWDGERNNGEMIALMHSELSEALEALRFGTECLSTKIACKAIEEELADVVIRIMDMADARGWDVADAIQKKIEYNVKRTYRHGKIF